jgi:hypothetical protein
MFAHARSHLAIRSFFQFVTSGIGDHETVIERIASRIPVQESGKPVPCWQAHTIDRTGWHPRAAA